MPRARGDKEYILPVKGLNTESNLLHFPQEFSPDCLNMEIDYNPQVVRPRKGIELIGTTTEVTTRNTDDHDIAINSYLWEAVAGDPNKNFIVVQTGRIITFYDDTTLVAYSQYIDLNNLLSGTTLGTIALAEQTRLDFTNVKGNLLMCSPQIDPVVLNFDDGVTIVGTSLTLQMRDMLGVDDGLETDERPATLTDDHKYNLYNQGWHKQRRAASGSTVESDPMTTFFTAYSEYPSNADIPFLGMVEDAGDLIFDPEWLRDQTFGSTPAAKGHYTVDVFNIDREAILAAPLSSGGSTGSSGSWNPYWSDITWDIL